ncbi:MAG: hypothetical protein Q9199_004165 [Rusavskia elegans]
MVHSQRNTHRVAVPKIPGKKLSQEKPHVPTKKYGRFPDSSWSATMGSHYLSIFTAWTLATVPMVILALGFSLAVLYSRPEAPPGSFYSDREQANISLGSAIYSKIPSTQLSFMASFSSTLATTLLPAVMALFSYTIALAITRDSDTENRQGLPSPFQLQLLISSLDGSLLSLWSFIRYLFGRNRRGVAVVFNLWKAVSLFSTMALLALLIAMTDAWLNFSVSTVQYTSREALASDDLARSSFTPGCGLQPACMDLPRMDFQTDPGLEQITACYTTPEDAPESTAESMKQPEAIEYIATPEGWIIVPGSPPANMDFEATTFGSSTSCRVVTNLCDIVQPVRTVNDTSYGGGQEEVLGDFAYDCKRDRAGLELSGNASDLRNASLFLSAGQGFVIEYYTDSTMTAFVTNWTLLEYEVVTYPTGSSGNRSVTPKVGVLGPGGTGYLFTSILSCTTVLSDVKYSWINGSVKDDTWTAMNQSTSPAFVLLIGNSFGNVMRTAWPQLQQGAHDAMWNATSAEHVASSWAKTYDQVVISLGPTRGLLLSLPPVSVIQSTTILVTRIPRAPFITLIVLDLVYAFIGTFLMVAALIAVRKGSGVRDAQARLSTLAVVAESFESPALGDDARDVNM